MDCKTARENINIFDSLSQQEKDEVLEHVQNCDKCRQELIESTKLLDELSNLDELEAPEGLAQSAIKKAKKRRLPVYSYVSVAVAAVIAVAIFATSTILGPRDNTSDTEMPMAASKQESSVRVADDAFGAGDINQSMMLESEESADAPEMEMGEGFDEAAKDGVILSEPQADGICYIYVSADKKEFVQEVNQLLTDKGIYFDSYRGAEEKEIYEFVVGEIHMDEFKQLLEKYEIEVDGTIKSGTIIQVTIE